MQKELMTDLKKNKKRFSMEDNMEWSGKHLSSYWREKVHKTDQTRYVSSIWSQEQKKKKKRRPCVPKCPFGTSWQIMSIDSTARIAINGRRTLEAQPGTRLGIVCFMLTSSSPGWHSNVSTSQRFRAFFCFCFCLPLLSPSIIWKTTTTTQEENVAKVFWLCKVKKKPKKSAYVLQ